ncbi:hypothetical protein P168DRAFT_293025 [Aspergillus campestris IBT 28561]|uniref:Uncharacterized protein n=1 Tax=Aspergillus campestris (strain IBT 28561) TaxID=1392248 RepID=A0A2I1CU88_ASPC2|nr:uncharacterized protein P168DRAFT_293025 [Aspergillus campestris IBT 28561]PKY01188.1 hypothetical protein P168DRAFT_293025 [Aspergillus campestris IBT 28561]
MTIPYDSIRTAQQALSTLSYILKTAEKSHPDPASLPTASLHPDMQPLSFQVHIATFMAMKLAARLTLQDPPAALENNLTTIDNMQARIKTVKDILDAVPAEEVNAKAEVIKSTLLGPKEVEISGAEYARVFNLPNIYFHVVTAYGILRKEGVPLGKVEYMTEFIGDLL